MQLYPYKVGRDTPTNKVFDTLTLHSELDMYLTHKFGFKRCYLSLVNAFEEDSTSYRMYSQYELPRTMMAAFKVVTFGGNFQTFNSDVYRDYRCACILGFSGLPPVLTEDHKRILKTFDDLTLKYHAGLEDSFEQGSPWLAPNRRDLLDSKNSTTGFEQFIAKLEEDLKKNG